jgi:phage recombination protein Bet
MNAPVSITAEMAARYGMAADTFEQTLRATVMPSNTTKEEFAAFLVVARQHGLNPILREIYAFPKKGGGIQPIVSIDGWANIINSHPQFDGMTFEDQVDAKGTVTAITCRIHRKDRAYPVEATEYLVECAQGTQPWRQWPRRMLRHKAMIQCARYAFALAGVIDPDEYSRYPAITPNPLKARLEQLAEDANKDIIRVTADVPPHDAETGELAPEADDLPSPYNTPENQPSTYDAIDAPDADEWLINPESSAYIKGSADAYKDITEGRTPKGKCRSSKIIDDPQMLANWRAGYESVTPLEASP